jgi:hypothetical protein
VGDAVENGPSDFLPLSRARVRLLNGWQSGWVVIWEDMLTLFGLWFHLWFGLGILTATELSCL